MLVVGIIALLMSILVPALKKVKEQANSIVCRSNLRQWGTYFLLYTEDYDGSFHVGPGSKDGQFGGYWFNALRDYHGIGIGRQKSQSKNEYTISSEYELALCPVAHRPWTMIDEGLHPTYAWGILGTEQALKFYRSAKYRDGDYGSYGVNTWVCNPSEEEIYGGYEAYKNWFWRSARVKGAAYIPLILDSTWFTSWPFRSNEPPNYNGENENHMGRYCIQRHGIGYTNCTFVDFSIRRLALKELWDLQWHRNWLTGGRVGGNYIPGPVNWPAWMENFPEHVGR